MSFDSQRIEPKPGQESVWDYPRPPRLEACAKQIQVIFNGVTIADTSNSYRLLETSHPPFYYIPPEDIQMSYLKPSSAGSFCEWKGLANYYNIAVGERVMEQAAWYYAQPVSTFAAIKDYVAFYPRKMDACYVNGELVVAQEGDFYGGWITSDIVGPFKGGVGTWGW